MFNWHRKVWSLVALPKGRKSILYKVGSKNEFSLEPTLYTGPDVKIGKATYRSGARMFRVVIESDPMNVIWHDLALFYHEGKPFNLGTPTGSPPEFHPKTPQLTAERLENNITYGRKKAVFRIYPAYGPTAELWVHVDWIKGTGGNGWVRGR